MENNSPVKPNRYSSFGRYQRYVEPIARDPLIRGYFQIIATILLVSFFLLFAIRPTLNTVLGLRRKISDLVDVDKRLNDKIQSLITAQSTYSKYESQLGLLSRALPTIPEVDTMIIDIQNIVSTSGLKMVSLSVDKTGLTPDAWVKNKDYADKKKVPLSFNLNLTGDFQSGQRVLKNLINAPRIISISGISFNTGSKDTTRLDISITGTAYFLP